MFSDLSLWQYALIALVLTHLTSVTVSVYLHRCQTHQALKLKPFVSYCFRLWNWLTTGMKVKEWVAVHRKHHWLVETGEDPHSPQVLGLRKVLLENVTLYRKEARNEETLERWGKGTPDDGLEHFFSRHAYLGVLCMLAIDLLFFGFLPGLFVWGIQVLWIPLAGGVINGVGHFWGYRNYRTKDESRNIFPVGVLFAGEELHNNHHAALQRAKFSRRTWEFDIGWLYIQMLQWLRLASEIKRPKTT
jgi:stearoyl-CoA desaturase (delta-9 desaturase)